MICSLILITISLASISPAASAQVGNIFRGIGQIVDALEDLNKPDPDTNLEPEPEPVPEEPDDSQEIEQVPEFPDEEKFEDLDQF